MQHFIVLLVTLVASSWSKPNISVQHFVDQINSKQSSWTAKATTSNEDFRSKLGFLGLHPDPNFQPEVKRFNIGKTVIPETFDAREKWPKCKDIIENIRNQGNCGSCWAFASAEVMSDRLCIQSDGKIKFEFSPEDIVSCCDSLCGFGCGGGYTYRAWIYFLSIGIVSGGDYKTNKGCKPYSESTYNGTVPKCSLSCQNTNYTTTYNNDKHYGTQVYTVEHSAEQIQMEIMTSGPVVAGYTVYDDFMEYSQGVYYHVSGKNQSGHAVKIIGWGTENEVPYWLVANSWGKKWGLNGFFKIKRGVNECGIEDTVVAGKAYPGDGPPPKTTQAPEPVSTPSSSVRVRDLSFGVVFGLTLICFTQF